MSGSNGIALLCVAAATAVLLWLAAMEAGALAMVLAAVALLLATALAWWQSLRPSNARDWQPGYARAPTARIEGERVFVSNVRNFRYRSETDFDEVWEEREYDLSRLEGLDMFLSHWTGPHIAHTIMSWPFSDGQHLAVSVETRRSKQQQYSAIKGFFRQYELIYVAGDERDLIGLRVGIRQQDVYLYRLKVSPLAAKNLLLEYFGAMNAVARQPSWYNALVTNCTTTIRQRVSHAGGRVPFSWKLFANGYLPDLLYETGSLDTSRPFPELKAISRITERARSALDRDDFAARIRDGLPRPTNAG